jgi:hypothetical protein
LNRAQVPHAARHEPDAENIPDGQAEPVEQGLLAAERHAALCEAFTHLPHRDRQLIALLIEDPPVPYAEISARLASLSAASGRTAAGAWTSSAITQLSPS